MTFPVCTQLQTLMHRTIAIITHAQQIIQRYIGIIAKLCPLSCVITTRTALYPNRSKSDEIDNNINHVINWRKWQIWRYQVLLNEKKRSFRWRLLRQEHIRAVFTYAADTVSITVDCLHWQTGLEQITARLQQQIEWALTISGSDTVFWCFRLEPTLKSLGGSVRWFF